MNLLLNPTFQIAQRGHSFNVTVAGVYTLDRWVSLADDHSRINIKRCVAPFGAEIEFNSAGYGGVMQILEAEQGGAEAGRAKKLAVNAYKTTGGGRMWLAVLAWSGATNKPTLRPGKLVDGALVMEPGWTIHTYGEFAVTATDARHVLDVPALPAASNIAVAILFEGEGGDEFTLRDTSLAASADYPGYVYSDELRRCSWFFQHYGYPILMNTEWGAGRADPGGFISFQFPLSYPLRGTLGGQGVNDVLIDWPVSPSGWWHYGGGGVCMFPGKPTITCHHRHFLLLTTPGRGTIPPQSTTIYRHWQLQPNAYVNVDAELRA